MAPTTKPFITLVSLLAMASTLSCSSDYEVVGEAVDVDPGDVTECGFTPVSETKMSRYDCNPVFTSADESWGPNVSSIGFLTTMVSGHPFYQMWYAGTTDSGWGYGLGYAVSGDGTNWDINDSNPLFNSIDGAWDQDLMDGINIVWDADVNQYVMAYQGVTLPEGGGGIFDFDIGQWGMGIATSPDGVTWSKHPANPVIDFTEAPADIFSEYMSPCWPLSIDKGPYGFTATIAGNLIDPWSMDPTQHSPCEVYGASSGTLDQWSIASDPMLRADKPYDAAGFTNAAVVQYDGIHYMFYVGSAEAVNMETYWASTRTTLNLATSTDGTNWTKDPNNPLPINLTSTGHVSAVGAQVVGKRIHLWVSDRYEELDTTGVGYFLFEPDVETHP